EMDIVKLEQDIDLSLSLLGVKHDKNISINQKFDSLIEIKEKYEALIDEHEKLKERENNFYQEEELKTKELKKEEELRKNEENVCLSDEKIYKFIDECVEEYIEKYGREYKDLKLPPAKKSIFTFIKEDMNDS
ncbi:1965_t:CDS:2, partial [Dentiscutata erythropus]